MGYGDVPYFRLFVQTLKVNGLLRKGIKRLKSERKGIQILTTKVFLVILQVRDEHQMPYSVRNCGDQRDQDHVVDKYF